MTTSRALAGLLRLGDGEARRLFLWAPVMLGLGVQLYFAAPAEPPASTPALAAAAAAALAAAAARAPGARLLLLAAAWVAAGFGLATLRAAAVAAPALAAEHAGLVEGRIRAIDQSRAGRPRLLLDAVRVYGLAPSATPRRVRLTLRSGAEAGLAPGDRVSAIARLAPPPGPAEPGAFDFRRAAFFDGLGAVGVARGAIARLDPAPPGGPGDALIALDRVRARVGARLRDGIGGEAGAFAAAIAIGDAAGLPPEALAALRDSNLAHLLSISGLHMVVVAGLAFTVTRAGLALVPAIVLWRSAKALAAAAGIVAATAYLALSGAETPTQRAWVMAVVAFAAMIAGRPPVSMRALAVAALAVLAIAPESLLEAGFQMSFAATLALVAAYEAATRRGWLRAGPGTRGRAGRFLAGLALTSAVAGAATAPFAAFHFNRLTGWGLPANLLAVPVMSVATAPALSAAAVAAPFGLEGPFLRAAGWSIDAILAVARFFASLPGAVRPVPAAPPAALGLAVAAGLWICLWRGPIRWAGVPVAALAAALWLAPGPRPAVLIARGGSPIGVLTGSGRLLHPAGGDPFAPEVWLRRDGDPAGPAAAAARPWADGPPGWRAAETPGGWRVLVAERPGARLPPAACRARTLVLGGGPSPQTAGACVAVNVLAVAREGAVAVRLAGDRVAIEPGPDRSARPWSR